MWRAWWRGPPRTPDGGWPARRQATRLPSAPPHTAPTVTGVVTIDTAGTLTGQFVGQIKNPDGSLDSIGRNLVSVTQASGLTTSSFAQTATGTINQTPVSGTNGHPGDDYHSHPPDRGFRRDHRRGHQHQPGHYQHGLAGQCLQQCDFANHNRQHGGGGGGTGRRGPDRGGHDPGDHSRDNQYDQFGGHGHLATRHADHADHPDHEGNRGNPGGRGGPRLRHPNGNSNGNSKALRSKEV